MTAHDVRVSGTGRFACDASERSTRRLDDPAILALARRLVVFNVAGDQIAALMDRARQAIPMLTSAEVVKRVTSHNPDCFWAIAHRDRFDVNAPAGEGYVAFLPLTKQGLRQLLDGTMDRRNPPLSLISPQHERPAGIYVWHVYAPGNLAAGAPLVMQKLWGPLSHDVDVYSWSINIEAARFVEHMGFRLAPRIAGSTAPQFHLFRRANGAGFLRHQETSLREPSLRAMSQAHTSHAQVNSIVSQPHVPSPPAPQPQISVQVARTMEDFLRAAVIRGAVFIGEQKCPYDEEFDGNDFTATHLIGYVGNEPAGCLRIRYFSDFAKLERLVVRREFRSSGLARRLVAAGVEFCRAKGFTRMCTYAQKRLTGFWGKCGFMASTPARELVFSDFDYVEMTFDTKPDAKPVSIETEPYVVIRPEGNWQEPGILERSAARGVSRPSAEGVSAKGVAA
jgi:predicted GNAT family N-acyltransferase